MTVSAQKSIKHTVSEGESIYTIAKKYNVNEKEIFDLNPKAKGILALKTVLTIPKSAKKKVDPPKKILKGNTYTVQNGESFYTISRKFNVGYETLTELNTDIKPENLQIGETILLPKGVKVIKETKSKEIAKATKLSISNQKHSVSSGESFYTIAKKYDVSIEELRKANPKIQNDRLDIKDIVYLPGSKNPGIKEKKIEEKKKLVKEIIPVKTEEVVQNEIIEVKTDYATEKHTVSKGETKFGIAKKYKITIAELDALNPSIKDLKVGQNIQVKSSSVLMGIASTTEVKSQQEEEKKEIVEDSYVLPMSVSSLEKADFLIEKARNYIGTRYRSGGTNTSGFDCSGFTSFTFNKINFSLPHSSIDQAAVGSRIDRSQAQRGDLIFFKTTSRSIGHVGIITEITEDDIKFIHSSTSNGVIISSVNERYYSKRFVQINRVL